MRTEGGRGLEAGGGARGAAGLFASFVVQLAVRGACIGWDRLGACCIRLLSRGRQPRTGLTLPLTTLRSSGP